MSDLVRYYGKESLVKMYSDAPDVFMTFITTYLDRVELDNQEWLALYKGARKKHKEQLLGILQSQVQQKLVEQDYSWGMRDSDAIFIDVIFDELDSKTKKLFGKKFVKLFAYEYAQSDRYWSNKYKNGPRYGDQQYFTKTKLRNMMNKYLDNGTVSPLFLIEKAADSVPVNVLRGYIKRVPKGLKNNRLKKILRETEKYSPLGYDENDLKNASCRRKILRRIVDQPSIAKRLIQPIEFKASDVRAIKPADRLGFLTHYYRHTPWSLSSLKPGGYGRRVKFDRDCTYDEVESLLFPLVIKEHKDVGKFLTAYSYLRK